MATTTDSAKTDRPALVQAASLFDDEFEREFEIDGDYLTSTKRTKSFDRALQQDAKEFPPAFVRKDTLKHKLNSDTTLVSGDKAGQSSAGDRWAPLSIPLERRLQTMACFWHTMTIPLMVALFFILLGFPLFWPILMPWFIYAQLVDQSRNGKLPFRSEWFRKAQIWSHFAAYFPARLHRSAELSPDRKYVFGYHPHGIIAHGAFLTFGTDALGFSKLFPGITPSLLTLEGNFMAPIYREYIMSLGLASVTRKSCEKLLNRGGKDGKGAGRAIAIVVGGAAESLNSNPQTMQLVLKKRKGFVKLAIMNGADLVPVMAFGENELWEQVHVEDYPWVNKIQSWLKANVGFTTPLFYARGIFNYDIGVMPYRRPLNIVTGKPVMVEKQVKPDPAYIDEIHKKYVDEVERLWHQWKDTFAKDRLNEMQYIG